MASTIKIKRSGTTTAPTQLASGELAYSWASGVDKLYIGWGSETVPGVADNISAVGGKFFTDLLDHTPGTLTASSAIIVDANSKIDVLNVDNLRLDGNTVSTTNTNGDLLITPNGTGKTVVTNLYIGDTSTSLAEYIQDATGGALIAGEGIDLVYDDVAGTTTISAEVATSANLGVASFNATDFTVTSGAVALNAERVQDIVGDMVSTNTESGISVTYDDTNGKLNFDVADPVITIAGDVDGSATMTNLGNTTINVTLDTVNTNVGTFGSSTAIPVVTVNGKGLVTAVSTAAISSSFTIAGDTGSDVFNNGETLTFAGTDPIDTTVTNNTVTISAKDATTTTKGVASFSATNFGVTSGAVSIKTGGVPNTALVNSSVTIGSTSVALGSTATAVFGLTELTVDNININGNVISSTNANGNISLDPNGTGSVDVNGAKIINLGTPVNATDAATKAYVDSLEEGLHVKPAVKAATTANLTATYNNGTAGVGSTLTLPAATTLTIDGVTAWALNDGILVKNQTNAFENGRYYLSQIGNSTTTWILTRCTACDESSEIPSSYVFVQGGSIYASTGWVAVVEDFGAFDVGIDDITWTQFSGAGTYSAGSGLTLSGTTFSHADTSSVANLSSNNSGNTFIQDISLTFDEFGHVTGATAATGTVVDSDTTYTLDGSGTTNSVNLELIAGGSGSGTDSVNIVGAGASTVSWDDTNQRITITSTDTTYTAGNGLSLSGTTLNVGGTANRITVNADTVDIASTYVGQTSITTLGTIATGTWNATTIGTTKGGTGLTAYTAGDLLYASATNTLARLAAGTSGKVLQINGSGVPVWGDIDGGTY